ncbi:MAG: hypothetical protein ACHQUC_08900 [Chlamydiales bacterium]
MHTSEKRILTTHVGSLPRDQKISQLLIEQEQGILDNVELLHNKIEECVMHGS